MTLISRSRFAGAENDPSLGPAWRVKYPSRFDRDALCCDILLPSTSPVGAADNAGGNATRLRLVNVHLDSLPITPSLRPRQLSIVAESLRAAGRGLVAEDFNPVLPTDEGLVGANGLLDVWRELRPCEDGFTWGVDGEQPFPANRLDKVAVVGLRPCGIEILPSGEIEQMQAGTSRLGREGEEMRGREALVKWSDHSGLVYSFEV